MGDKMFDKSMRTIQIKADEREQTVPKGDIQCLWATSVTIVETSIPGSLEGVWKNGG